MGGSVSTNHKSSNRIELSWFGQHFEKNFVFWPDPTHQPTHLTMHQPMGRGVSTDFKSSNRIEISQLVQVLLNFDWFQGFPGEGVGGCGCKGALEWWEGTPTHVHMHVHAHMHMCIWHYREFPGIPPMGAAICMKLSCLWHMHVHANVYVHACVCAHVWGTHPTTPTAIHPPPTPRAAGSPNHQKSWTNQDNSILFEDSLPLNTPELI